MRRMHAKIYAFAASHANMNKLRFKCKEWFFFLDMIWMEKNSLIVTRKFLHEYESMELNLKIDMRKNQNQQQKPSYTICAIFIT